MSGLMRYKWIVSLGWALLGAFVFAACKHMKIQAGRVVSLPYKKKKKEAAPITLQYKGRILTAQASVMGFQADRDCVEVLDIQVPEGVLWKADIRSLETYVTPVGFECRRVDSSGKSRLYIRTLYPALYHLGYRNELVIRTWTRDSRQHDIAAVVVLDQSHRASDYFGLRVDTVRAPLSIGGSRRKLAQMPFKLEGDKALLNLPLSPFLAQTTLQLSVTMQPSFTPEDWDIFVMPLGKRSEWLQLQALQVSTVGGSVDPLSGDYQLPVQYRAPATKDSALIVFKNKINRHHFSLKVRTMGVGDRRF